MSYRVDEKGKVFTKRMNKTRVSVTVAVGDLVIQGFIHVMPETRLKDELNDAELFIAITDARVVARPDNQTVYDKIAALIVNRPGFAQSLVRDSKPPASPSRPNFSPRRADAERIIFSNGTKQSRQEIASSYFNERIAE